MASFSDETLQKIRDRILVSDVAARYSKIEHRGNELWCCCPLHGEKTASMVLHDDTGFFHCFGCGKSGTIFNLVMEMEKVSFPEAVRELARQAGVELEQLSPQEIERNKQKEAMYGLYDRLAAYCHNVLEKSRNTAVVRAREYLDGRAVAKNMWELFNIGYMPGADFRKERDFSIYEMLKGFGYSEELLAQSGLFSKNHPDYCLFSGRIVFPIRDAKGNTVAFSGRDLTGQSRAKYINSSDSPIFNKRENLLGLYESLPLLKGKESPRRIIICEGNFDVVALHQAGLGYAMASCGTAFTFDHTQVMKRYADKVTCLFDSDDAGQKATAKALVILQQAGLVGEVAHLSLGKDASEVLQEHGAEALRNELSRTKEGFSYLVDSAVNRYDIMSSDAKLGVMDAVLPFLEVTKSQIVLDDLLGRLALTLGVEKDSVKADYEKRARSGARYSSYRVPEERQSEARAKGTEASPSDPVAVAKPIRPLLTNSIDIELRCMLYVMNKRSLFDEVRSRLEIGDMRNEEARELYRVLEDVKREGAGEVSNEYILNKISDPQIASDVNASFAMKEFTTEVEENIQEALVRIRIRNLDDKRTEIKGLMQIAQSDPEEVARLVQELLELNTKVNQLREQLKQQAAAQKTVNNQ